MHKYKDTENKLLTTINTLEDLTFINKLFSVLDITFSEKPFKYIDIYQQIILTSIGTPQTKKSKLSTLGTEVILTHIVDDYFDIYKNHKSYRDHIITLFLSSNLTSKEKNKRLLLEILQQTKSVDSIKMITETLESIPENSPYYANGYLKMILAGIILSSPNELKKKGKESIVELQWNLLKKYKILTITNSTNETLKKLWDPNDTSISPYTFLSTASSLQEIFACTVYKEKIDINLLELSNCILGPLVFLSNYTEENKNNTFYFIGASKKIDDFVLFIDKSWKAIFEYSQKNRSQEVITRIFQIYIAIELLKTQSKIHSFRNFSGEYHQLSIEYSKILQDINDEFNFSDKLASKIVQLCFHLSLKRLQN